MSLLSHTNSYWSILFFRHPVGRSLAALSLMLFTYQSSAGECPADKPLPDNLDKRTFFEWMARNEKKVKDPKDFICCLPESYRNGRVLIGHSSIAAQNGTPESPRVFFHPGIIQGDSENKRDTFIFSVNGGANYLNQKDSIEFVQYNSDQKKLDYRDISFETNGRMHVSNSNPNQCMACHGVAGKEPPEGPRPLFDSFGHWPRFVGGVEKCNPVEDALQVKAQVAALQNVIENPRFECLDKTNLKLDLENAKQGKVFRQSGTRIFHGEGLDGFDSFLFQVNEFRVARKIVSSKDYEFYKYAIFGLSSGACEGKSLNDWIPPEIQKLHRNKDSIDPRILRIKTNKDYRNFLLQLEADSKNERRLQKQHLKAKEELYSKPIRPSENTMACLKDPNHLPRSLQKFFGQSQMGDLELYQMDSWTKTGPKQARGSLSGWMRYLFEGRGIVISNWTMNLNVELYKGHPDFQVDLLKLDKELKQIQGEEDLSPKTCEVLRQKSLSALAQLAKSVTSKSLPPASQTEKAAK